MCLNCNIVLYPNTVLTSSLNNSWTTADKEFIEIVEKLHCSIG